MPQPTSQLNSQGQSMDPVVGADGTVRAKLGIGSKALAGLTPTGTWQAIATHVTGSASYASGDGVVVLAGIDTATPRPIIVDSTGRPLVVMVPTQGNLTDRSGSITAGGTRQQVAAALVTRKFFFFQNHSDTTMWINFGVDAVADQPSIQVPAGAIFRMEGSYVSTERIDVICATTGKKFTAKEA